MIKDNQALQQPVKLKSSGKHTDNGLILEELSEVESWDKGKSLA